jgi:hypothetical protein
MPPAGPRAQPAALLSTRRAPQVVTDTSRAAAEHPWIPKVLDHWFRNVEALPVDAKPVDLGWLLRELETRTLPDMVQGQGKERVMLSWGPGDAAAAGGGAGPAALLASRMRVETATPVRHNMPHKAPLTVKARAARLQLAHAWSGKRKYCARESGFQGQPCTGATLAVSSTKLSYDRYHSE